MVKVVDTALPIMPAGAVIVNLTFPDAVLPSALVTSKFIWSGSLDITDGPVGVTFAVASLSELASTLTVVPAGMPLPLQSALSMSIEVLWPAAKEMLAGMPGMRPFVVNGVWHDITSVMSSRTVTLLVVHRPCA